MLTPGKLADDDPGFPADKLRIVGVKTTCKDRCRQVLNEGKRVQKKHILTLQPGISANQLKEMHEANVVLIVPAPLHEEYPRNTWITILSVDDFIKETSTLYKDCGTGGLFRRRAKRPMITSWTFTPPPLDRSTCPAFGARTPNPKW
jgi:hypothetical protein